MRNFTCNPFPIKNLLIDSLLTPIVGSTNLIVVFIRSFCNCSLISSTLSYIRSFCVRVSCNPAVPLWFAAALRHISNRLSTKQYTISHCHVKVTESTVNPISLTTSVCWPSFELVYFCYTQCNAAVIYFFWTQSYHLLSPNTKSTCEPHAFFHNNEPFLLVP